MLYELMPSNTTNIFFIAAPSLYEAKQVYTFLSKKYTFPEKHTLALCSDLLSDVAHARITIENSLTTGYFYENNYFEVPLRKEKIKNILA